MNSKAISESEETPFAAVVESIEGFHPSRIFLIAVEVVFIFLPLLLHALYGVVIWWQGKSNVIQYRWSRNWMYFLQRWSGLIVFVFLIIHVYRTRFAGPLWDGAWHPEQLFGVMHSILTTPLGLGLYVIGLVASCFHFANGLWLVGITWGITIGPRSQKYSTVVAAAVGIILLVLGGVALYGFATIEPVTLTHAHP
jgi:succinate dehydrogenase / fumarate reductase cytochrome b subunit